MGKPKHVTIQQIFLLTMNNQQKKRILVVSPADSFFTMPHVRAFEALGFECAAFDNRRGMVYSSNLLKRLIRVFPWLRVIKDVTLKNTNRQLVSFVKEYEPWLVFSVKAENIYPETIGEIKKLGVKTGCFFIDFMDHWPLITRLAPAYDYFFSQDHIILRRLWHERGLKNCFYMAHSAEPMADPFTNRQDKYDVSFIGQHNSRQYPNREKYLLALNDLDLNIWGTMGWAKTPLAKFFHGRSVGDQRLDIYSHSKIVLDINWNLMPVEGLSNRSFEIMGCGAMFMTDHIREDIKRAYTEGREVVLFKDENEFREKIIYYLEHNKEREEIAKAGYAKTVAKHTYIERVKQLLDTIENPTKYLYK